MFFDPARFEFVKSLEANWQTIQQELVHLKDGNFLDWPEKHLYGDGWKVFGLYSFGIRMDKNCALCPQTTKLVEQIPGLVTAGFSRMQPNTHIAPHTGHPEGVLRCHLGLIVPKACGIRVGNDVRHWEAGKCMVFDDTVDHEAWNKSDESRIILLLDFKAPDLVVTQPKVQKKGLFARLMGK